MKTLFTIILLTSFLGLTAQASSFSSAIETKYKQAFQRLQTKVNKQNKLNSLQKIKGPQVIKVADGDDGTINPGDDVVKVEPIRFNKGRFKLERSYVDINDNYVFKQEIVCDGVFAIPVYDVRNTPDYYYDFSQTVNCFGLLDGEWASYQIGGVIIIGKDENPFNSSQKDLELKLFGASLSANVINSPVVPPENQSSPFWKFNAFATKDLKLNHALLSLDRGAEITTCVDPIEEVPVDPPQPRPYNDDDVPPTDPIGCTNNNDIITLTVELVD